MLFTDIGGKWFIEKHKSKIPPMKSPRLIKEAQKKEDDIKQNLEKSHHYWNYCKFQIHWNKLEWVVPKNCNAKKNIFSHLLTSFI